MRVPSIILTVLAVLCAMVCTLTTGSAYAGSVTQFGSLGEGAGQLNEPFGIAASKAADGDVYVADTTNHRVDEFEPSGAFVRAWGWGVLNGAKELQTCTSVCGLGAEGSGVGEMDTITGIAVDNDSLSSSYGDVYVQNIADARIEKFDGEGKFLLEFGEIGSANGQFKFSQPRSTIAIGPMGRLYVGDETRVQVFEPSGAWVESISLTGLSGGNGAIALTVDGSGDMFVADRGVPGVHEFAPGGSEKRVLDATSTNVVDLTVDEAGDLFIAENSRGVASAGELSILEYASSGEQLASFAHDAGGTGFFFGMAYESVGGVSYLYVTDQVGEEAPIVGANVMVVPTPVAGPPVIESGSVTATPERRGEATVHAKIEPAGNTTMYYVEYVTEGEYQTSGYASAARTVETPLGTREFDEVPVSTQLTGLVAGETYHYRITATNSQGTVTSLDQTVTPVPPALIDGPWVTAVTSTSVTLSAEIDPLGTTSTEYRVEYGTSTAYEKALTGSLGEGEEFVKVGFHRQELSPGTVYHYRVVVHNEVGTYATADHTFTTQAAGGQGLTLPDGRAWELVSPAYKGGALVGVVPQGFAADISQASLAGSAITYMASEPAGGAPAGHFTAAQILSRRTADGWRSQDVSERISLPPEGQEAEASWGGIWPIFSADLSVGLFEPSYEHKYPGSATPQSPEATERTLYLHDSSTGKFLALEYPGDVPSGTVFGDSYMQFLAGTPDLSHVVFGTSAVLAPGAVAPPPSEANGKNLYEWSEGKLQLVNVRPEGTSEPGAGIGSRQGEKESMTARAISSDGRWIVWGYGEISTKNSAGARLYVRDMVAKRTLRIGGNDARFETMSTDGSRVFYVETVGGNPGDLYVFDTATGTATDLTSAHGPGESSARVQDAVLGASDDGSYVYFVATGVLASGAVPGTDNLYVTHDTGSGWVTTYIATLSGQDSKTWRGGGGEKAPSVESSQLVALTHVSSRVSPNGRYVTFMSQRSLTGYDNLDAVSGQPDEEVYLYDAVSNRLRCVSCNPTGVRPDGILDNGTSANPLLVDLPLTWSAQQGTGNHWLAGSIPTWEETGTALAAYQPRFLSDTGRVYFQSPDALVPQDTNGVEDVYQYEPVAGTGTAASDGCSAVSVTFSPVSEGCVSLVSSGQSANESVFIDSSESGDDVFFATNSRLTGEDVDTAYDIYDAHVCTGEAPCRSEPVSPPPCTSGDSCKPAPAPQPEIFGASPSATFSGQGNVTEEAKAQVVKHRAKPKHKKQVKRRKKRGKGARKSAASRTRGAGSGMSAGKGGK
jgi:hypothetical protein